MRRHPVGFRYASALFDYAKENNALDQTVEELEVVSQVLEQTNLLDEVFKHPKMTIEEKKRIINESFTNQISQGTLNLLNILIDRNRESIFSAIVDNFKALVNEEQGVAEATVYSAKALSDAEKEAIADVFSKKTGKQKLHIDNIVDHEIIGGLKIKIGDRLYDGSVASQLERIQKQMISGNVSR